jgi:hypothetical protein
MEGAYDFSSLSACSAQRLQYRHNLYKLREEREMTPKTMLAVISNLLYEKRCAGSTTPKVQT